METTRTMEQFRDFYQLRAQWEWRSDVAFAEADRLASRNDDPSPVAHHIAKARTLAYSMAINMLTMLIASGTPQDQLADAIRILGQETIDVGVPAGTPAGNLIGLGYAVLEMGVMAAEVDYVARMTA